MFYCKQFYVCALVGVLIKCLYEMDGAAINMCFVFYVARAASSWYDYTHLTEGQEFYWTSRDGN